MKRFVTVLSRHPSHRSLRRKIKYHKKVILRLGSTTKRKGEVHLNSIEAVKNSSDKLKMKQLFEEAGIKTCKYKQYQEGIEDYDLQFPLVAKHRLGSRGTGNYIIKDKEKLEKFISNKNNIHMFLFEEFFSGCREYRLHVSKLGCFYSCRKLRKLDSKERWYFNSSNSVFLLPTNPKFNKPSTWDDIVKECQKAIKAVGLDIGGVDVRVSKKGDFRIIETNSAPSLGEIGQQKYIEHLKELVCAE